MGKSSNNDDTSRWLSLLAVFLTGVIAVLATIAVVRYEGKIGEYETRITELETDLDTFFQVLSEEIDYERENHRAKVSTTHANNGKKKTGEVANEEEQWRLMGEDLEHKIHPHRKPEQVTNSSFFKYVSWSRSHLFYISEFGEFMQKI